MFPQGTEISNQGTLDDIAEDLGVGVSELDPQLDGNYFYVISTTAVNPTFADAKARGQVRRDRPTAVDIADTIVNEIVELEGSKRAQYQVILGLDLKL